jgi:hypothetical protein
VSGQGSAGASRIPTSKGALLLLLLGELHLAFWGLVPAHKIDEPWDKSGILMTWIRDNV